MCLDTAAVQCYKINIKTVVSLAHNEHKTAIKNARVAANSLSDRPLRTVKKLASWRGYTASKQQV